MDYTPQGFQPGMRRENPRARQERERQEAASQEAARQAAARQTEIQPTRPDAPQERFDLKSDKGYREAKVLLRWLQQYKNDFDCIQDTGKIYDWVQGSGEKYAVVNEELAEMVAEKMESLGIDDPKTAGLFLQQEMFTRGSEHIQRLLRVSGLSREDRADLEVMQWNFEDLKPGQGRRAA